MPSAQHQQQQRLTSMGVPGLATTPKRLPAADASRISGKLLTRSGWRVVHGSRGRGRAQRASEPEFADWFCAPLSARARFRAPANPRGRPAGGAGAGEGEEAASIAAKLGRRRGRRASDSMKRKSGHAFCHDGIAPSNARTSSLSADRSLTVAAASRYRARQAGWIPDFRLARIPR
jgi:hypothetical protein